MIFDDWVIRNSVTSNNEMFIICVGSKKKNLFLYQCQHATSENIQYSTQTMTMPEWSTETGAKVVGCYVRHDTQNRTRVTGASNCIPRTKSYDTDSATEGDQTGASQAQEQDKEKERQRRTTRSLSTNGQPLRDWRIPRRDTNDGEPPGDNGSRATAGPTTLTDKDDDSCSSNGSNGDKQ